MKFRTQKLTAILAATALSISSFGGVAVRAESEKSAQSDTESSEDSTVKAGDAQNTETADNNEEAVIASEDGEAISADMISGTFKPSDAVYPVQDSYEYPFLGLKLVLPEELLKQMEDKSVAMLADEEWTDNLDGLKYAYLSWSEMTQEQKDAEVERIGTGYEEWVAGLAKIGIIGVYDEDSQKNLDDITGCTEHKELGSSSDGKYKYYLSLNKDADQKLTSELEKIETTFTDMTPLQQISVFEQPQDTSAADVSSVGKFETKGIDGETYTEKVFSDYDLTLVNVFTTWCSPCVNEIPELEKLYEEMKEKGIGVVGVVLDAVGEDGTPDEETVKKAEVLQEKTKASYPFLIPDSTMMNGRLNGISAFPESFFVDKDGNIVGETYLGSHDFDEWKEIVEKEAADK